MRLRALVLFSLITCLPATAQTRGVTVERADIVQISSSEDSPNINRVSGNVTVIVYKCTNVVYCGSDFVGNSAGTYSLVSSTSTPLDVPIVGSGSGTSLAIGSGIFSSVSNASTIVWPSLPDWAKGEPPSDRASTWGPSLGLNSTDVARFDVDRSGSYPNFQTDADHVLTPGGITISSLDPSAANAPTFETSPISSSELLGQLRTISGVAEDRDFGKAQPAAVDSRINSPAMYGVTDPRPPSWAEGQSAMKLVDVGSFGTKTLPDPIFIDSGNPLGALMFHWGENSNLSDPMLGVAGQDRQQYLKITTFESPNVALEIGLDAGVHTLTPPTNFATGFDKDSLSQQLEDLSKSKKKIVGWTLIIEDERQVR